jgi:N-acetylmuramoyl-L-alanine amidase
MHGNGAGVESASGYEVFTSPSRNFSDDCATILYNHAKMLGLRMRSDWTDGDPDKEARFAILTKSVTWAALIETGFFTNYSEARLMATPSFQKQVGTNLIGAFYDIRNAYEKHYNVKLI